MSYVTEAPGWASVGCSAGLAYGGGPLMMSKLWGAESAFLRITLVEVLAAMSIWDLANAVFAAPSWIGPVETLPPAADVPAAATVTLPVIWVGWTSQRKKYVLPAFRPVTL